MRSSRASLRFVRFIGKGSRVYKFVDIVAKAIEIKVLEDWRRKKRSERTDAGRLPQT